MKPDGHKKTLVGTSTSTDESTGILDVSDLLGYPPSYAMITTNQGYPSSMTLLLNPGLANLLRLKSSVVIVSAATILLFASAFDVISQRH